MREPRYADQETQDRLHRKAYRMMASGYAPTCCCEGVMYKDRFNGMWHCWESGHGGYQTQEQVTNLIYGELLEGEGYDG